VSSPYEWRREIACRWCGEPRYVASLEVGENEPCRQCASSMAAWLRPIQGDWVRDAVCASADPEAFFPYMDAPTTEVAAAKVVCAGCPVQTECLTYALEADEPHGIWGGLTPRERRRLKKKGSAA
jgi:WhiB family transcriptional regulator, redox-sensing transcriptional regulator